MSRFYLWAWLVFGALRAVSLISHFWGPSPWGGPTVLEPLRLAPDAVLFEVGLVGLFAFGFGAIEAGASRVGALRLRAFIRVALLLLLCFWQGFAQFDQEVVRWMAQHVSSSFINNFFGVSDPQLLGRILTNDRVPTALALLQIAAGPLVALGLWQLQGRASVRLRPRTAWLTLLLVVVLVALPAWFRPSEKRWRRIRPAAVAIVADAAKQVLGQEEPKNPEQARLDLYHFVRSGTLEGSGAPSDPQFPLASEAGIGSRTPAEAIAAPRTTRPNIIVIVFETMRAWNTGLVPDAADPGETPELDAIIKRQGAYFPWSHASGYPSVEGAMGMHLGMWPHFRKIVFSDFLHIRTLAFPEVLRSAGYKSFAVLGADPSFSNFTPWMKRWYDDVEFDPQRHHDGPLVDRMQQRIDGRLDDAEPLLALLWTATTHPPYDIPASEGIRIAESDEGRFVQAMRYADKNVARLIRWLEQQPGWDNTVVVVLGDHAQPVPWQRLHPEVTGPLTPGHTWTTMSFLGGWPGLPAPGLREVSASHLDLAPTLISLVDLKVTNAFMGRNLFPRSGLLEGRPLFAFRDGEVVVVEGEQRTGFRVDGGAPQAWMTRRASKRSYGMLDEQAIERVEVPAGFPVERYRDMILEWSDLLEQNRVLPQR